MPINDTDVSAWMVAQAPPAGLTEVIAPYMGVFFLAFFIVLVVTPILRLLATRHGIIDWPDLHRKNHLAPVAYLGGVAIFVGWVAGVALGYGIEPHNHGPGGTGLAYVGVPLSIILGAAAIMFTGLFDDLYGISPRVKVGGQLFAAGMLASQDVGLDLVEATLHLVYLPSPEWLVYVLGAIAITLFVVGGCNAFNLLDGQDGLAAGVTVIGCLGLLVMAALVALNAYDPARVGVSDPRGDPIRIVMCLATVGAVLGFLPYNFNPATIFMGDAGSLLLGFLAVATLLLFAAVPGSGPRLVTAGLIVLALPIADTALATVRRAMRGQPLFEPDSEHLHHLLRHSGLSVRQTVVLLYGAAAACAVLGCTLVALELRWRYVMAVFVVLFSFVLVSGYKYGQRQRLLAEMAVAPLGVEETAGADEAVGEREPEQVGRA